MTTRIVKAKFKASSCILPISVGQKYHEGEWLKASLNLVENTFNSCIIAVNDTLQRHTMAIYSNENPHSLYQESIKAGDEWLKRNHKHCNGLNIPTEIIRWDHWLNDSSYHEVQAKLLELYHSDIGYQQSFEDSINVFTRRFVKNNGTDGDITSVRKLCFDYILEECTVLILWLKTGCQFELYPNKNNQAIEETRKRYIHLHNPNILRPITINFNHRL